MLRKAFVVCLIALAGQAQAGLIIDTSVGTYDVSTIDTSFNSSTSLLQSQRWWGDFGLAVEFATLVGDSLGLTNNNGTAGPFFASSIFTNSLNESFAIGAFLTSQINRGSGAVDLIASYAIATKVDTASVPEPGTLSLLGAGLCGFGFMRRRRIA